MKAIELARMLLMYPEATVLMDTGGDDLEPIKEIDLKKSMAVSNDSYVAVVAGAFGYARAKK